MAAQSNPSSTGSRLDVDKSRLLCTYRKRRGHDVDNCWSKHGYPEWWEHKNPRVGGRSSSRSGRGSRSFSYSRDNHTQVQRNKPVHTSSVATMSRVQKENNLMGSSTSDAKPGITTQQWQCLLNLFGNSTSPIANERLSGDSSNSHWIIGSSSFHHITGNLSLLTSVCDVQNCPIGLPDGKHVLSTKKGVVCLSSQIVL